MINSNTRLNVQNFYIARAFKLLQFSEGTHAQTIINLMNIFRVRSVQFTLLMGAQPN